MILFLPKILSVVLIVLKRRSARAFGGVLRLSLGVLLEILLSSLLAPIRMVFHSRFVLLNLVGRTVGWGPQGREEITTSWREALRHHGLDSLFASAWGAGLFWLSPGYFWWVTPVIGALILSVPLSVYTSRSSLGERARRWGLFVIPEETSPPPELQDLRELARTARQRMRALPERERAASVSSRASPVRRRRAVAALRRPRLRPRLARRRGGRAVGDGAGGGGGGRADAGLRAPPSRPSRARAADSLERGTREAGDGLRRR